MVEFTVNDITCGHCVSLITRAVKSADEAATCEIDLRAHRVRISSTGEGDVFEDAIRDAGYTPIRSDGGRTS